MKISLIAVEKKTEDQLCFINMQQRRKVIINGLVVDRPEGKRNESLYYSN